MLRVGDRVEINGKPGKIVDHSEPLMFTVSINCTAGNPGGELVSAPGYKLTKIVNTSDWDESDFTGKG